MSNTTVKPAPAILYVDDEASALKYFARAMEPVAKVYTAESVAQGKQLLDEHADHIAVLVSDQRMPGSYGNELLFHSWDRHPHIVRILTTAYSELDHTIEAVNQGQIHRYIPKPWDLTVLRMEMKQALNLARLQKDHHQLLREKLLMRRQQTVASRIGMLYALAASLGGDGAGAAVEGYLSGALGAWLAAPELDWLAVDQLELTSSEAFRCAAFGARVREQLAALEACHGAGAPGQALTWLAEAFGPGLRVVDAASALCVAPARLAEFLATPGGEPVSPQHASWLACLLWLARRGMAVQVESVADGVLCRLAPAEATLGPAQLAAWIEQF